MSVVIVTGAAGLIGSEAAVPFPADGHDGVSIDSNLRVCFVGAGANTTTRRDSIDAAVTRRMARLHISLTAAA